MLPEDKKRMAHKAVVTRVLEGDGRAARADRRAAFENADADRQGRQTADTGLQRGRRRGEGVGHERGSDLRARGMRRHRSSHAAV